MPDDDRVASMPGAKNGGGNGEVQAEALERIGDGGSQTAERPKRRELFSLGSRKVSRLRICRKVRTDVLAPLFEHVLNPACV